MHFKTPRLSMLDLVAVREGGTVRQALDIAVQTAQKAEALGFARYWLAEHHNMPGIASSARVPKASATTSGGWLGSMMPPEPTRMRVVWPAMWPISTAVAELAMPGMLWCSASQ